MAHVYLELETVYRKWQSASFFPLWTMEDPLGFRSFKKHDAEGPGIAGATWKVWTSVIILAGRHFFIRVDRHEHGSTRWKRRPAVP